MEADLALIRKLQKSDSRIAQLEKELEELPRQVAAIEQKLKARQNELAALKKSLADTDAMRRKLEGEAAAWRDKDQKLNQQVSEATTNDQYRAFRNEINFARKAIKQTEDRILEHLEAAEELQAKVASTETSVQEETASVEQEVAQTRERFSGDQQALAAARKERAEVARGADPKLMRAYTRVYKKLGAEAISPMIDGRCGACRTTLRPQLQQNLRTHSGLVTCEFCGAILYVEPPPGEGLEDPAGDAGIA
ncbi:MAG: hypothetical protein GC160_23710 [Acidobacteria bacterium]|nr:hypothetical protein [Acidobacteriota bacterium]